MHINRDKTKLIANKGVDYTIDAVEVICETTPKVVENIVARTGPYIVTGLKVTTKTLFDVLYKVAFRR